jgi:hypothetical protein
MEKRTDIMRISFSSLPFNKVFNFIKWLGGAGNVISEALNNIELSGYSGHHAKRIGSDEILVLIDVLN